MTTWKLGTDTQAQGGQEGGKACSRPCTPQHVAASGPSSGLSLSTTDVQEARASNDSQPLPWRGAADTPLRTLTLAGQRPTASGPQAALWARSGGRGTSERRLSGAHAPPRCGLPFFFFFFFSGRPQRLRTGCGMGSKAPASGSSGAVRSSQGEAAAASR